MASRALVIAPGEYQPGSNIPGWPTIAASGRMYREVLAGDELWGADGCRVLDPDEAGTIDGVMRALEETAAEVGPSDTLLVVYVGHGACWGDVPAGDQVHFSVGTSQDRAPWTWLNSWYVYRAMRKSAAGLKVLIADCCYSHRLGDLGPAGEEPKLPGVMGRQFEGTCVLSALGQDAALAGPLASAAGCPGLPAPFDQCTPFSGHLLNVLARGTRDRKDHLTFGLLREAIKAEMEKCTAGHPQPRMVLRDAPDGTQIFTNRMAADQRVDPSLPTDRHGWIDWLKGDPDARIPYLLKDECTTADVVATLCDRGDDDSLKLAEHIDIRANEAYRSPDTFARYFSRMERRAA
ncbi:hypothetical protein [Streptomyces sp. NBC_00557]|uniref:hypothetical protein n=1 Tax=Streptomyces sp. NBC_00557 TaxID=2975776 RepID=UPI002E8222ED|nr:hypothetical protein [Streptomyces sp. NBC_00557]WUC32811.1 hypothetical protein OG956_00515 [Streptomyces sp. NBC_00557]